MEAFLHRVARTYIKKEGNNMSRYCFVFPNKRSGVFFLQHIESMCDAVVMLPCVTTISDLVNDLSGTVDAGRLELLYILYNEYTKVVMAHSHDASDSVLPLPGDFDRFMYWGDMLLSDFNDVDKYLADPSQLFKNVRDFKGLNSNYLTEDQKMIIQKYWGEDSYRIGNVIDDTTTEANEEDFWRHVQGCGQEHNASKRFLKLWEILYDVYTAFNVRLAELGLSYSGMSYRKAANVLKQREGCDLPYKRYVFVGFNVLSTSELLIFERLQAKGLADFYWDFNSPALRMRGNKAARFLENYIKEFISMYDLEEPVIEKMPRVRITGVPSNTGQIKEVSSIIGELIDSGEIPDVQNAINTAVVLPDENLFLPLISNIPAAIENVNITMGFPLRNSPVAMLISKIVGMQLRVRKVKGDYEFFRDDVMNVLSHPIMRMMPGEHGKAVLDYMAEKNLYNLPHNVIETHFSHLQPVFTPVKYDGYADKVYDYFKALLDYLAESELNVIELQYINRCHDVVNELQRLTGEYGIKMQNATFFHLVERALFSETISFKGEPLKGLQVMGVLETRALDFKNVIMLSMNERVFPRKHFTRSFIPDTLRRGYGLSTVEFQESIYAYYFYRLIARADNVYLLFDARNTGLRSGEMSRYLYQLRYFFRPDQVSYNVGKYYIVPELRADISIPKTTEVMKRLERYLEPESGYNFSASAFKQYIKCPLQFYFERVADINIPDDAKDYIDEGIYGNIVHHVAEKLYSKISVERGAITNEILDELAQDRSGIVDRQITASINKLYYKRGDDDYTPLQGEALIQAAVIKYILRSLLMAEKMFTPIKFEDAEWNRTMRLAVDNEFTVNFKLAIDRIDTSKGLKRVVDYKTGSDETVFPDILSLFSAKKNYGGIFQTFLYCFVYASVTGYNSDIQPYIYSLKTLNTTHLQPLKIGTDTKNTAIRSYLDYKDEFWSEFQRLVREIYNKDVPFVKGDSDHACMYCKYVRLCGGK